MPLAARRAPDRPRRAAARLSGGLRASAASRDLGRRAGLLALAFATLALAPLLAGAAVVEQVAVRAAAHPGFGRLVLEWPAPIEIESRRSADRLTLRFSRPFAADLGAVAGRLGDYLVELVPGADQREVVLQLVPEVAAALDVYDGRIVVLDLTAGAAASAPVELRTGLHDGYVRIVLDWAMPIGFETIGADRRWRIVFDREGEIDAAAIGRRFRDLLADASAARGGGRSELALTLKPGVRAEVFKVAGERVVVDLYGPDDAAAVAAAAPATVASEPRQAPQRLELPEPAAAPAAPAPVGMAPRAGPPTAEPAAAASLALQIGAAEVARGVALDFVWDRPVAAAFMLRAGYLWSVFAVATDGASTAAPPALASPVPGYLGPGELVESRGGMALRFPLRRPLAASVAREGARWRVILDDTATPPRPARLERRQDPHRLRIATGEAVQLVRLIDPEVGDRLEFGPLLAPGIGQPRARRLVDLELLATAQGLAWRTHSDRVQARSLEGAVELFAPEGLRLSSGPAPAPPARSERADRVEPSALASLDPPATTRSPASAVPEEDRLVTAQGAPPSPDRVLEDHDRAASAGEPGPATDPEPDATGPAALPSADGPAGVEARGPLGLARFARADGLTRAEQRAVLQGRIAGAAAHERTAARLDLARWFLAEALGVEALAVLAVMDEPDEESSRLARASLAGAAELLTGRLDAAAAGLGVAALDDDPESALWRAAQAAARSDWAGAARQLARSGSTLNDYPPALQLRLGLPAARIAIEAGNHDLATLLLARLAALDLHPKERARVALMKARAYARRGELARADPIWRGLEQGPDREARVAAAYARTEALLEAGRLSPAQALARLTPARPLWRGHPMEFEMSDRLAETHLQGGDPAAAIRVWQELLRRFASAPGAARIATRMRDSFLDALLAEDGARIGAVQAYALYQDFPELLRFEGELDDRVRHRLARELARLDLIEPAAGLLEELIDRRSDGPGKAEAGAELAELWLRAPDPAAALAALERSRIEDELSVALGERRELLRARALAAADQEDAALALLDGHSGRSGQRLRAELLWQKRDWPRLAECIEGLLARRDDPAAPLSDEDQDLLIRLALARARQGARADLAGLRARFGEAMRGQEREAAFLMATVAPLEARPGAPEPQATLAAAAEQLARARGYLEAEPPRR